MPFHWKAYIGADFPVPYGHLPAAHNEFLGRIITTLDTPLRASRLITSRLSGANQNAMPLHHAVSNAISKRDAGAAEEAMRRLVLLTTEDVRRAFDE